MPDRVEAATSQNGPISYVQDFLQTMQELVEAEIRTFYAEEHTQPAGNQAKRG